MTQTEQPSIARRAGKALRAARGDDPTTPDAPATEPATVEPEAVVEPEPAEATVEPADAVETADPEVEAEEPPTEEVEAEEPPAVEAEAGDDQATAHDGEWVQITPGQESAEADPGAAPRRSGPSALLITSIVLLAAALVFSVIAGVLWARATRSPARTLADQREAVLRAAEFDVTTLNTSDYRNPQAAINQWLSVTTDPLRSQITGSGSTTPGLIKEAKMVTSATVEAAAVTGIDLGKGTATVMLSVEVNHKPVSGTAVMARNRLSATMTLVNGQWRLGNLGLVSVQLS